MIITDTTIVDFNKVSWSKCNALHALPTKIAQIKDSVLNGTGTITQADIIDLSLRLRLLQKRIRNYAPNIFIRLWNLITGKKYKLNWLENALPEIILAVGTLTSSVIAQNPTYKARLFPSLDKSISEKMNLVQKAIEYVNRNKNYTWGNTAEKVETYFKTTFSKLESGIDVPLPNWYHATRNTINANSIVLAKKLKQSKAPCGTGVFVSSQREWSYGSYAFAIDTEAVRDTRAHFFGGTNRPSPYFSTGQVSLWSCVYSDVPIRADTVAFAIFDDMNNWTDTVLKSNLASAKIPIIDSKTSDKICEIFGEVTKEMEVPDGWKISSVYFTGATTFAPFLKHVLNRPYTHTTSG